MIITLGENPKGFTVQKQDIENETIFFIDGLSFDEAVEEMRE